MTLAVADNTLRIRGQRTHASSLVTWTHILLGTTSERSISADLVESPRTTLRNDVTANVCDGSLGSSFESIVSKRKKTRSRGDARDTLSHKPYSGFGVFSRILRWRKGRAAHSGNREQPWYAPGWSGRDQSKLLSCVVSTRIMWCSTSVRWGPWELSPPDRVGAA